MHTCSGPASGLLFSSAVYIKILVLLMLPKATIACFDGLTNKTFFYLSSRQKRHRLMPPDPFPPVGRLLRAVKADLRRANMARLSDYSSSLWSRSLANGKAPFLEFCGKFFRYNFNSAVNDVRVHKNIWRNVQWNLIFIFVEKLINIIGRGRSLFW